MVWPFRNGKTRGITLEPLYPSVPEAAVRDQTLYEWLALADALRLGQGRVSAAAKEAVHRRIDRTPPCRLHSIISKSSPPRWRMFLRDLSLPVQASCRCSLSPNSCRTCVQTQDTDAVVQVLHIGEWLRLRAALLACGFRERAMARESRQILFWLDDLPVDFIPPRLREFGTANRWLDLGFELAEESQFPSGRVIERLPASAFLAAKIAAFLSRGRQDVFRSDDLDDIAALLVGRPMLAEEMSFAHPEIRTYVREHFEGFRR